MANGKKLRNIEWKDFKSLPLTEKGAYFQGTPPHTLIAQQFTRGELEELCALATRIKRINKRRAGANFLKGLLSDKRAMLYFAQPSSRTYLSFEAACLILGLDTMDVRDTTTSSEVKGESPEDTLRTFSSYADMIIMRHPTGGFAERVAWMMAHTGREVPVLNAGSGSDQHPTQALLDIYTLARSFEKVGGGIDGKRVAFVGDLARGRTVRSLAWMLTLYNDMTLYFVAPESLQIGQDILDLLDAAGTKYVVTEDFESVMPVADAIYMTRIQDEWDVEGESTTDASEYRIGAEHMDVIKQTCAILHPLPRRKEISTKIDNDPRAVYWRQMRNGMWIRAALILKTFGREDEVNKYYDDY